MDCETRIAGGVDVFLRVAYADFWKRVAERAEGGVRELAVVPLHIDLDIAARFKSFDFSVRKIFREGG